MFKSVTPITENEAQDNRRFITWFTETFKHYDKTENLVDWEDIYTLHKEVFPSSSLEVDKVHEILNYNGFITTRYPDIRIIPNIAYISIIGDTFLINKLLTLPWEEDIMRRLRNIRKRSSYGIEIGKINGHIVDVLMVFYRLWCVDCRIIPQTEKIPINYKRAIVGDVRKAFETFCLINSIPELPWGTVDNFLNTQGHHKATGYAWKRSGQSYYRNLLVPVDGYANVPGGVITLGNLNSASKYNQLVRLSADGLLYHRDIKVGIQEDWLGDRYTKEVEKRLWRLYMEVIENLSLEASRNENV